MSDSIKSLREQIDYISGILRSLTNDIKKLEARPIPIIPDIKSLREEVRELRSQLREMQKKNNS